MNNSTPARPPGQVSARNHRALHAIASLPMGEDGWRRATYRDQLHESAGLSRGAMQRALADVSGLVEVQRVGRSARLPEGYRLTADGEAALARLGKPSQIEPVPSQPDPVFSGPNVPSEAHNQPPVARDPASQFPCEPDQSGGPLELGPRTLAVLYAAFTGTPLCGCAMPRPMVLREQGRSGRKFMACVLGKRGCGATASYTRQQRREERPQERPVSPGPRDMSNLLPHEIISVVAGRRKA